MKIMDELAITQGIVPAADAFSGTVYTDVIKVHSGGAAFLIVAGGNAGGVSQVTVQACSDTTPSATSDVAFQYKYFTTADSWSAWTQATTTGFATANSGNYMYLVYVPAAELAESGYQYCRLKLVETTNAAVTATVVAMTVDPRYAVSGTIIA